MDSVITPDDAANPDAPPPYTPVPIASKGERTIEVNALQAPVDRAEVQGSSRPLLSRRVSSSTISVPPKHPSLTRLSSANLRTRLVQGAHIRNGVLYNQISEMLLLR